ncbi:hypothetical protein [Paraburkholderia strydomiana]|uniref:hypothetical protein n=1 Tax=Paraburkholderia strydomiana TaxID=1245417 RepID=UPI001BE9FA38|nr:hypothetical protein [Paraburkholderia strydomiana]MBT2794153.1 hypothetical protein [Paraburkholderia strydomiana]
MKTLFAALASALLVSTAFAQTAAPAPSEATQPAGQANLKASTAVQTGASNDTTTHAKAPSGTTEKSHVKTSSKHTVKKHNAVKKTPADSSAANKKTDGAQEASNAPVSADGAKTGTTKTQ